MPRYKVVIEYDGSLFVGWQRQENGLSVQEVLETAAVKLCGVPVTFFAAGRTDAGVHAWGQVAHIDWPQTIPEQTLCNAINHHLGDHRVAVLHAEWTDDAFDARLSARQRAYHYRIINRRAPLTMDTGKAWQIASPLDVEAMQAAADLLVGHHDFTSFRSTHCMARSPLKTLDQLAVTRSGDEIRIEARARSFMHNQVRIIAGSLKRVGEGKWQSADMGKALAARDRSAAGPTAPPQGLYLLEVVY